jgi:hypothetical protein
VILTPSATCEGSSKASAMEKDFALKIGLSFSMRLGLVLLLASLSIIFSLGMFVGSARILSLLNNISGLLNWSLNQIDFTSFCE